MCVSAHHHISSHTHAYQESAVRLKQKAKRWRRSLISVSPLSYMTTTKLFVFVCVSASAPRCVHASLMGLGLPSLAEDVASGHSGVKRGGSDGQSEARGLELVSPPPPRHDTQPGPPANLPPLPAPPPPEDTNELIRPD